MSCNGDYYGIIFGKEHLKKIEWLLGIREFRVVVDNSVNLLDLEKAVNRKILKDGYIYANQIFEMLGVKFDPDRYQNWLIQSHVEFDVFNTNNKRSKRVIVRW